jgi:hypothetical protein
MTHPGGRPTKYKPEYCEDIVNYFNVPPTIKVPDKVATDPETNETKVLSYKEEANDLPLFVDYSMKLGVSMECLHEWQRVYPEFSEAYKKAKQLQERNWQICSLKGLFNPAFTIFMGKNVFKWTDKQQVQVGNIDDEEIKVSFVDADKPKPI